MPVNAAPLDLAAEHDRLVERYRAARETIVDDSVSAAERQQAQQTAAEANRHVRAVAWLREEYGDGAEFVVGGLTMEDAAKVLGSMKAAEVDEATAEGLRYVYTTAAGVLEAPFYGPPPLTIVERGSAIAELPRFVGQYLRDRVDAREVADTEVDLETGGSVEL